MFTTSEIFECIYWFIAQVLFPCAVLYAVWLAFRQPAGRKFNLVSDIFRCAVFVIATVLVVLYMAIPTLVSLPPHWLERARQRHTVYERAHEAGGWDAIKKDANGLVQKYAATGYQWFYNLSTNNPQALPVSFVALKPKSVDLWPEEDGMCSVRIGIFGMHSTGGRGQDIYVIKVVCPFPTNTLQPFRVNENAKVRYGNRKIADGVFEYTHPG